MAFNVGDRVIMNKDYAHSKSPYHRPKGSTGIVRADLGSQTTVEFDNYTTGHNGGGTGLGQNSCVHVPTTSLDLDPLYKTISFTAAQGVSSSPAPAPTPASTVTYNVGDRVEMVQPYGSVTSSQHLAVGRKGTYRGQTVYGSVIEFDNFTGGHDCGGVVPGSNACLYLAARYFKLISSPGGTFAAAINILKSINVKPALTPSAPAKSTFEVGDRVVTNTDFAINMPYERKVGSLGTVKGHDTQRFSMLVAIVEFDGLTEGGDGNGTVPGSKACLYIAEEFLDKISIEYTTTVRQKDFFDHSDIFKPEIIDRIWENTMGRPVKWPELPPAPEVKLKATASSPRPYVKGDVLKCIKGNHMIDTGDTVEFIKHIQMTRGPGIQVKILTGSRVGYIGGWYAERFEHLNAPASGGSNSGDNYLFAKRDSWTKEETDELWNHLQDICRG